MMKVDFQAQSSFKDGKLCFDHDFPQQAITHHVNHSLSPGYRCFPSGKENGASLSTSPNQRLMDTRCKRLV